MRRHGAGESGAGADASVRIPAVRQARPGAQGAPLTLPVSALSMQGTACIHWTEGDNHPRIVKNCFFAQQMQWVSCKVTSSARDQGGSNEWRRMRVWRWATDRGLVGAAAGRERLQPTRLPWRASMCARLLHALSCAMLSLPDHNHIESIYFIYHTLAPFPICSLSLFILFCRAFAGPKTPGGRKAASHQAKIICVGGVMLAPLKHPCATGDGAVACDHPLPLGCMLTAAWRSRVYTLARSRPCTYVRVLIHLGCAMRPG